MRSAHVHLGEDAALELTVGFERSRASLSPEEVRARAARLRAGDDE